MYSSLVSSPVLSSNPIMPLSVSIIATTSGSSGCVDMARGVYLAFSELCEKASPRFSHAKIRKLPSTTATIPSGTCSEAKPHARSMVS